jgi:hypothetical protein
MNNDQSSLGCIVGVVENTDGGSEYEGVIFSRFLTLRVSDERLLRIFDPAVLSGDLQIGETCKVIIIADLIKHIQYFPERPASIDPTRWVGRIVSTDWRPSQTDYRAVAPSLNYRSRNVLVETSIGDLIIDTINLKDAVEVGGFVIWEQHGRFDLLAIV